MKYNISIDITLQSPENHNNSPASYSNHIGGYQQQVQTEAAHNLP